MTNIEEKYNKLKKKYNLPGFENLDREFEISTIENQKRSIRRGVGTGRPGT